jgi:hypothetical protein
MLSDKRHATVMPISGKLSPHDIGRFRKVVGHHEQEQDTKVLNRPITQ